MKRILFAVVAAGFLLQSGFVDALEPPPPAQPTVVERKVAEKNCRTEGEGEGLADKALEEFVEKCVQDVLTVHMENKVKL